MVVATNIAPENNDIHSNYVGSTSLKLHTLASVAGKSKVQKQFSLPLKKFLTEGAAVSVIVSGQFITKVQMALSHILHQLLYSYVRPIIVDSESRYIDYRR